MGSPEVRLFVDDELIRSLPFEGERLRIGRRPENDLVIEDLAVSRMHAVLVREADGRVVLEDAGSGNGSYLDGERIEGRAEIPPGRPVRMGRHVIVWVGLDGAAAEPDLPAPQSEASGSQASAPASGEASLFDFALEEDLSSDAAIDDDGVSFDDLAPLPEDDAAMGADDLLAPDTEPPMAPEAGDRPLPPVADDPTDRPLPSAAVESGDRPLPPVADDPTDRPPLADESTDRPLPPVASEPDAPLPAEPDRPLPPVSQEEIPVPTLEMDASAVQVTPVPADPGADPLVRPEEPALHAGLVVQHRGALLRVVAWDADRMCIGRGDDCEILLDETGVSRRHALLVRDGATHEVRDLESINGTEVNGESVRRRVLEAGDVIRIEDFQLTFLLDHSPIADEVQVEKAESRVARGESEGPLDLTLIREITDPGQDATGDPVAAELDEATVSIPIPEEPTISIPPPAEDVSDVSSGAELDGSEADLFADEDSNPLLETSLDDQEPADLFAVEPEPDVEATVVAPELVAPEVEAPDAVAPELEPVDAEPLPRLDVLDDGSEAPALEVLDEPLDDELKDDAEPAPLTTLIVPEAEAVAEGPSAPAVQGVAQHGGLSFELGLSEGELPEALARALEEAEDGELRIPVELRIRRSD